jgi:hypothetical protein
VARTLYDVLEVAAAASQDDIRRAYLAMARRLHPDASASADQRAMQEVNEAWRVLRDPHRRADYDRSLDLPPPWEAPPTDDDDDRSDPPWDRDDDRFSGPVVEVASGPSSWAVLVPAAMFVAAAALFALAMMLTNAVALALAFGLLVISAASFVVAPFLVMTRRRRRP